MAKMGLPCTASSTAAGATTRNVGKRGNTAPNAESVEKVAARADRDDEKSQVAMSIGGSPL